MRSGKCTYTVYAETNGRKTGQIFSLITEYNVFYQYFVIFEYFIDKNLIVVIGKSKRVCGYKFFIGATKMNDKNSCFMSKTLNTFS